MDGSRNPWRRARWRKHRDPAPLLYGGAQLLDRAGVPLPSRSCLRGECGRQRISLSTLLRSAADRPLCDDEAETMHQRHRQNARLARPTTMTTAFLVSAANRSSAKAQIIATCSCGSP